MPLTKLRAKRFAKALIEEGFNNTAALRKIEPKVKERSLEYQHSKAYKLGHSESVKKSLSELMEESGLSDDRISKLLDRNATQTKNIPASNQAIDIALKVKGAYAPEKKIALKLDLKGSIDDEIETLTSQLEGLKKLSN